MVFCGPHRECDMSATPTDDPVLRRFRAALAEIYGDQLERVILFGSRARGDARPDSDYDVAVFLKSLPDRWKTTEPSRRPSCRFS
jgi:predicted nucleotidyltransferase